jgi:hypothetical protein
MFHVDDTHHNSDTGKKSYQTTPSNPSTMLLIQSAAVMAFFCSSALGSNGAFSRAAEIGGEIV